MTDKIAPFEVRTVAEGTLLSAFADPKQAAHAAEKANDQAQALGIQARYEVKEEEPAVA